MGQPAKSKASLLLKTYLIFILLAGGVSGQGDDAQWWEQPYEEGLEFFRNEQLLAAESKFKEILKKDKKVPQAYYGLGLVYNWQMPGSKQARRQFEKAIRLDRNFAEAYYQLALVYEYAGYDLVKRRKHLRTAVNKNPALVEAWITLAEMDEELEQFGTAINTYARAVKSNPGNHELYSRFVNATVFHGKENVALSTMESLVQKYPEEPDYLVDLAHFHYVLGDYAKSSKILTRIETTFPQYSSCRKHLLRAKLYFDMEKANEGWPHYVSALNTIHDRADARIFYEDNRYVMTDSEYEELSVTPLDGMRNFYIRFWRSRDPNLATPRNERVAEYYRRLSYARKHYRRYSTDIRQIEDMYRFDHPYASLNMQGNRLLRQAHLPKPLHEERNLDDSGIIYVRHGEPDRQVASASGIPTYVDESMIDRMVEVAPTEPVLLEDRGSRVPNPYRGENLAAPGYFNKMPRNMSWKYRERRGRPEMIFHFKRYGGAAGWIIETIPYVVADREGFDPLYRELGRESFRSSPNSSTIIEVCKLLEEKNREYISVALQTVSTDFKLEGPELRFPFQFTSFKSGDNKDLVEFYYFINGRDVRLDRSGSKNLLNLQKFIGLYDEKWNEAVRIHKEDETPVDLTFDEWRKLGFVEVERFSVPPGTYTYEILLKDMVSDKLGVYRGSHTVRDFQGPELMFSDVILSGHIQETDEATLFRKRNVEYSPHMFMAFGPGETVGVYFELYNLSPDSTGKTDLEVSCTLEQLGEGDVTSGTDVIGHYRSILGDEKETVATTFRYGGERRDEKITLNFDPEEKLPGRYELVLHAKDLNSGHQAVRKVTLYIL